MTFELKVKLPLREAPHWLSHIEIYREGDEVVLDIMKVNGLSYGHARTSDIDFNNMTDLVLTRSMMEKHL